MYAADNAVYYPLYYKSANSICRVHE